MKYLRSADLQLRIRSADFAASSASFLPCKPIDTAWNQADVHYFTLIGLWSS